MFGRKDKKATNLRRAARPQAEAAGWTWRDAAPAPAQEICEAVLRRHGTHPVWPTGLSDVVNGAVGGRPFTGGHLVGYAFGTTRQATAYGDRVSVEVVWMPLPDSLPELRIVDTQLHDDDGVRLPPLAVPDGLSPRWSLEGFVAPFAAELLTPAFVATLETAPPSCTVVIRAGVILCYGDPVGDTASIATRANLLAALIASIPPSCWGRADALIAGTGVSPTSARDGRALVLAERLVERDWRGSGLAKITWEQTPEAKRSATLPARDQVEVWTMPADDAAARPPGIGGVHIDLSGRTDLGIPTVASTLGPDRPPSV
ncbi:hypothetical protein [Microbacterium sp. KR10-403]|uniref:hypothetical protein n=1 Tax=Microbacterium sp. KR10-403 TaxID=3158581 RepID=UPI0032E3960C